MKSDFLVAQIDYDYPDSDIEREIVEKAGGRFISAHLKSPDEIVDFASDADGIIVQYAHMTKDVLTRLPRCRIVSRYGIGLDNIDLDAAKEIGICVVHNPAYCIDEVSDHAAAMVLNLLRQISYGTHLISQGVWDYSRMTPIKASGDTVIGIFGFGRIGRRFARKMLALGYQCIGCDPYVEDEVFASHDVRRVSLTDLFALSDCISIHCSLTEETRGVFNGSSLGRMKEGAFIVNTSRGPIVDIEALCALLESGHIRGAALDVLPEEPPRNNCAILQSPRVLLTPHAAFYSDASIIELRSSIARQVVEFMKGNTPTYPAF